MNSLMGKKCLFSFQPHTTSTHTFALDRLLIFVVALKAKKRKEKKSVEKAETALSAQEKQIMPS
jgi:hypothetical protein